jgi:predicted metalloprotease with PDZ domain
LLALTWDYEIRAGTGGKITLDDVLRAQARQAVRNAKAGRVASADALFPQTVRRIAHLDLRDEMARYVDRGAAITLPADLFAPCAEIVTETQPLFDRGFNLGATLQAHGHLKVLEAGGPAERAGLKADDHILIDEIPSHDSHAPLTYRVKAAEGSLKTIRYKPEGVSSVSFQQVRLTPLAAADPSRCNGILARP